MAAALTSNPVTEAQDTAPTRRTELPELSVCDAASTDGAKQLGRGPRRGGTPIFSRSPRAADASKVTNLTACVASVRMLRSMAKQSTRKEWYEEIEHSGVVIPSSLGIAVENFDSHKI